MTSMTNSIDSIKEPDNNEASLIKKVRLVGGSISSALNKHFDKINSAHVAEKFTTKYFNKDLFIYTNKNKWVL